jgi:hypothetical protein
LGELLKQVEAGGINKFLSFEDIFEPKGLSALAIKVITPQH